MTLAALHPQLLGDWVGENQLWMNPAEPPLTSPSTLTVASTAQGRFLTLAYTWGFNDETCPPTSMYSAYNVIPGEKRLLLALETGHNNIPEQVAQVNAWLVTFVKK